jgi:hypothetical protein
MFSLLFICTIYKPGSFLCVESVRFWSKFHILHHWLVFLLLILTSDPPRFFFLISNFLVLQTSSKSAMKNKAGLINRPKLQTLVVSVFSLQWGNEFIETARKNTPSIRHFKGLISFLLFFCFCKMTKENMRSFSSSLCLPATPKDKKEILAHAFISDWIKLKLPH